jgi:hypothetical protein
MEELPRILNKVEMRKTTDILRLFNTTCAIEVKVARGDTLYANSIKPHQRDYLLQAKHGVFRFKIPDSGRKCPFDAVVLAGVPAFVVVVYGDGTAISIDIDALPPITEKLTKEKALAVGKRLFE